MKNWPRWRNLTWATASQSHRICEADSSSRHLSQMGSSVNHNLKRCPFRWQCPVSSPTTHLSWSLFNFNRSLVLLAEGPNDGTYSSTTDHNFMGQLRSARILKVTTLVAWLTSRQYNLFILLFLALFPLYIGWEMKSLYAVYLTQFSTSL
jgi:hypothetical protein